MDFFIRHPLVLLLTAAVILFPLTATAGTLYVKSAKASLLESPAFGAPAVATIAKGDKLLEVTRDGRWVQVAFQSTNGWISTLLVSEKPPIAKVSLLNSSDTDMKVTARRRASAFTSAAAARGLAERSRASSGFKVDYDGVEYMKSLQIETDELNNFIGEEDK